LIRAYGRLAMGGVDVLVVTALQEEFDAARDVVGLEY
jgi:hypothetical protein